MALSIPIGEWRSVLLCQRIPTDPGDGKLQHEPSRRGRTISADLQTLAHPPTPAHTIADLHTHLDAFLDEYNHRRPHRSLPHRGTPATAYQARPKADPATRVDTHNRVRTDRIDQAGSITLRVGGRLHHIGVGRIHNRTRVLILAHDLNIKIVNAATGELLREFVLDPTRDSQPAGAPKGPTRRKPRT